MHKAVGFIAENRVLVGVINSGVNRISHGYDELRNLFLVNQVLCNKVLHFALEIVRAEKSRNVCARINHILANAENARKEVFTYVFYRATKRFVYVAKLIAVLKCTLLKPRALLFAILNGRNIGIFPCIVNFRFFNKRVVAAKGIVVIHRGNVAAGQLLVFVKVDSIILFAFLSQFLQFRL